MPGLLAGIAPTFAAVSHAPSIFYRLSHDLMPVVHFFVIILLLTMAFIGLMWVLHQTSSQVKKWLTIVCTFIAGLYFLLEYFLPTKFNSKTGSNENIITPSVTPVSDFFIQLTIWLILLGLISLLIVHGRKLIQRSYDWYHSLAFFIALIAMLVLGFWSNMGEITHPSVVYKFYTSLFYGLLLNLDAAVFSLLAFYIASAAFRAFRIRSLESALLMLSALIVMVGLVNLGSGLTDHIPVDSPLAFLRVDRFYTYILSAINMPVQRAITYGVSIGALAMSLRLWLSLERGIFFAQEN